MKKKQLFPTALFSALLLVSCGGHEEKETAATEDQNETSEAEVVEQKSCNLKSYSFALGDRSRTMNFTWDGDHVSSVETVTSGSDQTQKLTYSYNENGTVASFELDGGKANYIYNDEGKLTEIKGEGSLNTRTFEYDDQGNIVKQVTLFGGKPYTTHEYSYENGVPVKVAVYDKGGALTEENAITYDDKHNPFVNMGVFANSSEMMLGYPVANQEHNVAKITKTYKKKTSYMIDGAYKMPGDTETNELNRAYDENGYPVSEIMKRGDNEIKSEFTYDCK